jgi:hypothetical protein
MNWHVSYRADPIGAKLADGHYTRQSPGSPQFVPPSTCVVLIADRAVWATSWPLPEYVKHAWPGAWICSIFRNEGSILSSLLIREAIAATRWFWPDVPVLGMVTFVDASKVRRKRDPGRCFRKAGFHEAEPKTTRAGLIALQLLPHEMPDAAAPRGANYALPLEAA